MQFADITRATAVRFDHAPGLTEEERILEDVRLSILSGTFVEDTVDEELPIAGRIQLIHPEHETAQ